MYICIYISIASGEGVDLVQINHPPPLWTSLADVGRVVMGGIRLELLDLCNKIVRESITPLLCVQLWKPFFNILCNLLVKISAD